MSTEAAAILQGDYTDLKFIKGRSVCQMVVEFDIAYGEKIVEMFGTPKPERGVPVAIARLSPERKEEAEPGAETPAPNSPAPGAKRHFSELPLSQQAALTCDRKDFWRWLDTKSANAPKIYNSGEAARVVRALCSVASRAWFDNNSDAADRWRKLYDEFRASQLAEQHGAH